jgi:hypothetical protein
MALLGNKPPPGVQAAISKRCEAVLRHALAARGAEGVRIDIARRPRADIRSQRPRAENRPSKPRADDRPKKRHRFSENPPRASRVAAETSNGEVGRLQTLIFDSQTHTLNLGCRASASTAGCVCGGGGGGCQSLYQQASVILSYRSRGSDIPIWDVPIVERGGL